MDAMAALSPNFGSGETLAQARMALARGSLSTRDISKAEKVSQDFEAVFLSQMLENMFSDVDIDPTADGPGEDTYKSMLLDEYGKIISKSGGIGVAGYVKQEMLKLQEIH